MVQTSPVQADSTSKRANWSANPPLLEIGDVEAESVRSGPAHPRPPATLHQTKAGPKESCADDRVGYRRPPKQTRWKKGQSGNPNPRAKVRSHSVSEYIDQLLEGPVSVTRNGERSYVTGLEAILLQLLAKEMAGGPRALKVRLDYQGFALRRSGRGKITVIGGLPEQNG
jgi:hypothetical protein